jgi:Na+/H+-dicarboxylate symporter
VDVNSVSEVADKTQNNNFNNFIEHIVPKSIFEAMSTNEILQIVVSRSFGLAAASIEIMLNLLSMFRQIITYHFKMVNYVMNFAPIGVLVAIAGVLLLEIFKSLQ